MSFIYIMIIDYNYSPILEDFTKENLQVGINSENPKRLDYVFPCKLSGNVEVISGDIYFGFYLG